jgi:hypothetical protein
LSSRCQAEVPEVHKQLGRAAVRILAANDRINPILIEHLDPAAWRAKPRRKARTICGDLHSDAQRPHQMGQAYSSAPEASSAAQPRALHAAAGRCGIGRRAPRAVPTCSLKRSAIVPSILRFAEELKMESPAGKSKLMTGKVVVTTGGASGKILRGPSTPLQRSRKWAGGRLFASRRDQIG